MRARSDRASAKDALNWDRLTFGPFTFHLAASGEGLCRVLLPGQSQQELEAWRARHLPLADLSRSEAALSPYAAFLQAYLAGKSPPPPPLDLRGTPFQRAVWQALAAVPYGQTVSYTQLAEAVGRPGAVRAVAAAVAANPVPPVLPCHRVIGKDGSLTGYAGGLAMKRVLLELERSGALTPSPSRSP